MLTIILNLITLALLPLLIFAASSLLSWSQKAKDRENASPFECGITPYLKARTPFSSRFFLLAILFLIFDIEIVILLPLVVAPQPFNNFIWGSSLFIIILIMGLLHEWNEGSLNWFN